MKVCHIAPLVEPLGDQAPGGSEHLVRMLAGIQSRNGDEVSVIAATGSKLEGGVDLLDLGIGGGILFPIRTGLDEQSQGARSDLEDLFRAEARVFLPVKEFLSEHGGDFDVIHNHAYDSFPLFELEAPGRALLHTLHLPPFLPWVNERLRRLPRMFPERRFVCVSHAAKAQYRERAGIEPRVIHCGLSLEGIELGEKAEEFFLWVGRISPEKGLHRAIECVCERFGARLTVIGRVYDDAYFRSVESRLRHPLVEYLGPLPNPEVLSYMRRASALVLPLEWDEPFGLVMIEALASGTPVITCPRGAAPEIVREGVNGFLAADDAEIVEALGKIRGIDRRSCRETVESRYSLSAMSAAYDDAYRQALEHVSGAL